MKIGGNDVARIQPMMPQSNIFATRASAMNSTYFLAE
jgi:hypothetical protein